MSPCAADSSTICLHRGAEPPTRVMTPLLPCAFQAPPPPRCHSEEDEDLNQAFDIQCFQQILRPVAYSPPGKHRVYDEQDIEGTTPKLHWFLGKFEVLCRMKSCEVPGLSGTL